jgi:lipopolysaccharide transport system ATP-binding protein
VLKDLCTKGVYLDQGRIRQTGKIDEVIDYYVSDHESTINRDLASRKDRQGNGKVMIAGIRFADQVGNTFLKSKAGSM